VTGATGFVGGRVARALALEPGLAVTATGRRDDPAIPGRYLAGDLASEGFVSGLFADTGFDAVVHMAALVTRRTDPGAMPGLVRANVLATANLAAAAAASGCRIFIYASSIAVYGSGRDAAIDESVAPAPDSPYGWSKLAGEQVAQAGGGGGMAVACLRLAGIHGPGRESGAVAAMLRAAMAGDAITVSEPNSRFRFLFVDDVVLAVRCLLDADPAPSGVFNLAGAEAMTLAEMAERIRACAGSRSAIEHPAEEAPARSEVLEIDRIRAATGFSPLPFDTHVGHMADELRG